MRGSVNVVHDLVCGIHPGDPLEAEHQDATLGWLVSTDDVFRRVKPATPEQHLVSYVALVDPDPQHFGSGLPAGLEVQTYPQGAGAPASLTRAPFRG